MKEQLFHIEILLKRLGIVLILYSACRLLFFVFNMDLFPPIPPGEFLQIMGYGLRYDVSSIIYVNIIFIILHVIPNPYFDTPRYQRILKILFYSFNGLALLLESGDWIYFEYGLKQFSKLGFAFNISLK